MVVGVVLVQVTEELVKTLFRGEPGIGRTDITEPPFADESGAVAGLLQGGGHGEIAGLQGLGCGIALSGIAADAGVAVMETGHEHTARRRADGGPGVEMVEAYPFRGHAVETRRFDDLLPVAAEVAPAEIVGHDPDEVGAGFGG